MEKWEKSARTERLCLTKYRIEEVEKDVFTDIVNIVKIDITLFIKYENSENTIGERL